jgi:hypothetical protein
MNPYPSKYPKVRGGFSPLQSGSWNPNSGLGDLCTDYTDPACIQTGATAIDAVTGQPLDTESPIDGFPSWMVYGAGVLILFLVVSKR